MDGNVGGESEAAHNGVEEQSGCATLSIISNCNRSVKCTSSPSECADGGDYVCLDSEITPRPGAEFRVSQVLCEFC